MSEDPDIDIGPWEVLVFRGRFGVLRRWLVYRFSRANETDFAVPFTSMALRELRTSTTLNDPVFRSQQLNRIFSDCLRAPAHGTFPVLLGQLTLLDTTDHRVVGRLPVDIKLLSTFENRHFVRVLDCHRSHRPQWYITQRLGARGLAHVWNESSCPSFGSIERSWILLRPLVEAVARLHKRKVFHRGINGRSVSVNSRAELVLGDLGAMRGNETQDMESIGLSHADWQWVPVQTKQTRRIGEGGGQDVYGLIKLWWALIAGQFDESKPELFLQDHYYWVPEYSLQKFIPSASLAILEKCVFGSEFLPHSSAGDLIGIADAAVSKIKAIEQKADGEL